MFFILDFFLSCLPVDEFVFSCFQVFDLYLFIILFILLFIPLSLKNVTDFNNYVINLRMYFFFRASVKSVYYLHYL